MSNEKKEFPKGGVNLPLIKGGEPVIPRKYNTRTIIHNGIPMVEVQEIWPEHKYQGIIYPLHPSTKQ